MEFSSGADIKVVYKFHVCKAAGENITPKVDVILSLFFVCLYTGHVSERRHGGTDCHAGETLPECPKRSHLCA